VNSKNQTAGSTNASLKILEAARAVASRDGAGKITIDAVAQEAGLSKGGVLYNFPSKKALISGLLDQMISAHRDLIEAVPEQAQSRTLLGHLETVLKPRDGDVDLSMAILAAAASDPQLLDPLRAEMSEQIEHILSETQDASTAMVVVLAIQGLRFQNLLKLPDGGAVTRARAVQRLRTLIDELE